MDSPDSNEAQHWAKTRSLMFMTLGIWFVLSFLIHAFVGALNNVVIIGFPLGYYMASQGALILFVILIFWFAGKQEAIDEEHGYNEE